MSSESSRVQTRPANADRHPGEVITTTKKRRRTKAEMEAARAEERASQEVKDKAQAELLKTIARLEDQLAQSDAKGRTSIRERPRPQPRAVAANSVSAPQASQVKLSAMEKSQFPQANSPTVKANNNFVVDISKNDDNDMDVEVEVVDAIPFHDDPRDENYIEQDLPNDIGEEPEEGEDQPKKKKKLQRDEKRGAVKAYRKVVEVKEEAEGEPPEFQLFLLLTPRVCDP